MGKIIDVKNLGATSEGMERLDVRYTPLCVFPARSPVPEWLTGQELIAIREVFDPREVGMPGDSLLLTPEESIRLLRPLQVTPEIAHGSLPEKLQVRLHWWKDAEPPPLTLSAGGREVNGILKQEGDAFSAEVETAPLFDVPPPLPLALDVHCGPLRAQCPVFPVGIPAAMKLNAPPWDRCRLENDWYALEVATSLGGGAITSLREQARGVEHFPVPADLIQRPFESAGQFDRYAMGWKSSDKMQDAAMTIAGIRQESAGTRLFLEGVVDDEMHLHTSLTCLLYDHLPLIGWQRTFQFVPGKPTKGKPKPEITVPIDEVHAFAPGFRTAWMAEPGSRILCADNDHLVVFRPAQINERMRAQGWWMSAGWALVEHPERQQCMLYLFDPIDPPLFAAKREATALTLKPWWPMSPMLPGDARSLTLAISAGEIYGAEVMQGVWLACRKADDVFGVHCAVVARLRELSPSHTARFRLGGTVRELPLQECALPGIGPLQYAVAEFSTGRMTDSFEVTVAGIPSRKGDAR